MKTYRHTLKTILFALMYTVAITVYAQSEQEPPAPKDPPRELDGERPPHPPKQGGGGGGKWKEKIETAKIGFITQRLNLTSEQAQQFWPIYNELENKKKALRDKYEKNPPLDLKTSTDEDVRKQIDLNLEMRQAEIDLDKEYKSKFLKVINIRQLAELYRAERDFNRMLLRRLDDKNKVR